MLGKKLNVMYCVRFWSVELSSVPQGVPMRSCYRKFTCFKDKA